MISVQKADLRFGGFGTVGLQSSELVLYMIPEIWSC